MHTTPTRTNTHAHAHTNKHAQNYTDRIREAQAKTGLQDGVRTGTGLLHGIPVALGVMEFGFMGGSMGSVVGEKLTRLIEYATQRPDNAGSGHKAMDLHGSAAEG
eukprot:scaffold65543_cov19-Tisochrysis_lutea.AAC.3